MKSNLALLDKLCYLPHPFLRHFSRKSKKDCWWRNIIQSIETIFFLSLFDSLWTISFLIRKRIVRRANSEFCSYRNLDSEQYQYGDEEWTGASTTLRSQYSNLYTLYLISFVEKQVMIPQSVAIWRKHCPFVDCTSQKMIKWHPFPILIWDNYWMNISNE